MPGTRSTPRLLSLVFVASVVSFCFFVFLAEITVQEKTQFKKTVSSKSKKIVAFSLRKQIEIERKEYDCDGKFVDGEEEENQGRDKNQWVNIEETQVFVYSVYHDRRLFPYDYLRIIAMVRGTWNNSLFCQVLTSDGEYYVTKAIGTKIWSKSWNQNDTHPYYNPFLISCHVPSNTPPVDVFFSTEPCQRGFYRFKIPVTNSEISKFQNSFTICVKPLNFRYDINKQLLQWITINKILGATKIHFYIEKLSRPVMETLQAYQKHFRNFLVLHQHQQIEVGSNLDKTTRIWQKRRYEIITYNDCLYRNIHTSHFVVPIDIDEVIIPRHVRTWAELLQWPLSEGEDGFASYTVRNAYYLRHFNANNSKEEVFFFRDVVRSDFSNERESGKSFISTRNALTVFNHYALEVLRPGIGKNTFLKIEEVQMNHYKDDCDIEILPECAKYLSSPVRAVDNVVFKYKKVFHDEYEKLLKLIKLSLESSKTKRRS